MALLDDILQHLRDTGTVDETGGSVGHMAFLPDSPDAITCVVETGGREPDRDFVFPTFQVLVRGTEWDYPGARAQMQAVFTALHNATIGSYVYVFATSDPTPMGYDWKNRPVISLPFKTMAPQ